MAKKAVEEKTIKPEKKVEKKKKLKKNKKKEAKKASYLKEVGMELKKVTFPSFKEVMKYTFATIVFCVLLVAFFLILNLILSGVKGMF